MEYGCNQRGVKADDMKVFRSPSDFPKALGTQVLFASFHALVQSLLTYLFSLLTLAPSSSYNLNQSIFRIPIPPHFSIQCSFSWYWFKPAVVGNTTLIE